MALLNFPSTTERLVNGNQASRSARFTLRELRLDVKLSSFAIQASSGEREENVARCEIAKIAARIAG
jgi:hypothetical protein